MSLPPPSSESTCVVTGASAGIGVELASALGRREHGLTLVAEAGVKGSSRATAS